MSVHIRDKDRSAKCGDCALSSGCLCLSECAAGGERCLPLLFAACLLPSAPAAALLLLLPEDIDSQGWKEKAAALFSTPFRASGFTPSLLHNN